MDLGIRFTLLWSDPDVLKIRVSAWNGMFGGVADVYEGVREMTRAAEKIRGFPLTTSDVRALEFGAFGPKTAGGGVKMDLSCTDSVGHAIVDLSLESDYWSGSAQSVHAKLHIEAAAVDEFVAELEKFGAAGVAALKATAS